MSDSRQAHAHETEGVIKFQMAFEQSNTAPPVDLSELIAWRVVLHRLRLLGQQPERYDGYGFGNVSVRAGDCGFVISGTQTGAQEVLDVSGFSHVLACDVATNTVRAAGPVAPSSESLTHGAVYALEPRIGAVLHVHSPDIWAMTTAIGLAAVSARIAYGTPDMARAVARLHGQQGWSEQGIFSMLGHEDGVVSFAADVGAAAKLLIETLAAAMTANGRPAG